MNEISITGKNYASGQLTDVSADNEKINSVSIISADNEFDYHYIAPGLVDIQVNGFSGIDFNGDDLEPEQIKNVTEKFWKSGITGFFPTIVTSSPGQISRTLQKINIACSAFPEVEQTIGGIHLEGPFISSVDGPRGAHDVNFITSPDWSLISKWQTISGNRIKIITLSPEWDNSCDFISKCTKAGIIISIGHTSASSGQIKDAVKAGARLSTHLGNGAHLMLPRHPNYIWDQLAEDSLWTSIITDGFHLPDSVIKVIMKVKGDHTIIISDCTKYTGMNPGEYTSTIGGRVVLDKSGRLYMEENPGLLAGSARSLLDCVNHMVTADICPLSQAWNMASLAPLSFMKPGIPMGINKGSAADMVLFDLTEKGIKIIRTIKRGKIVYESSDYE